MDGFIKISKYAGMREDLVQAGGGNSSFKINDSMMIIKASGFQLADVTKDTGYAVVDYNRIKSFFLKFKDLDLITESESKGIMKEAFLEGTKPSIETFLHSVSGRYTLHTHPIVVNVLTCRVGGMEVLKSLFPNALMVPYATPGLELAKAYFSAYKNKDEHKIIELAFLKNHGMVVSGETADEVIEKTECVVRKIEEYLKCDYSDYHRATELWRYFPDKVVWRVTDKNILEVFERSNLLWDTCFCPDCVVFLGKKILNLPEKISKEEISAFEKIYGIPVVIFWKNHFYILAENTKKAMEIQSVLSFSAQVMDINRNYKCDLLLDKEQEYLLNWDAEKYRKTLK